VSRAEVFWINGPVLKARPLGSFSMKESVTVGPAHLAAEVIRLEAEAITVQVFEDTTGLKPGIEICGNGMPLAVELGPGLLGQIFDGIQRPLVRLSEVHGDFIAAGSTLPILDRDKVWQYEPATRTGDEVDAGHLLGSVQESTDLVNRVLVPPGVSGIVEWQAEPGRYSIEQTVARIKSKHGIEEVALLRKWPIRTPRPFRRRMTPETPLFTGQRIVDTLFPIAKGGAGAMPGGFGTGKTVLQQTLAKWCDADIIVYIGCGERGNEMADVLDEFPKLEDPRTGRHLMERTVLIANTSNMPVAAREASIYTGITIAEYFRDQGYHVALFADSISRWAEALREISGRLEELPAEEGYPAYLPSRLAEFFERSGRVEILQGGEASLTVVATVSPPGGDFSEPVTAHARRFVRNFLALDRERAQARFYPAIHPLQSYSDYVPRTIRWWQLHGGMRWAERRARILALLQEQSSLERMVKIVGRDALPAEQRLVLVCAGVIVEAFLRQSAFSVNDRYCPPEKQVAMLQLMDAFVEHARGYVARGGDPDILMQLPVVRRIQRMGDDIAAEQLGQLEALRVEMDEKFHTLQPESSQ
jgi:V/A-type H+-transporting ATPase subunit A